MSDSFDPYLTWLGITDPERPPNHYRLLGVEELERDVRVIARSADARMANLRRVQPGERTRQWQQLLDEMNLAKLCLIHPARKAQYDKQLEERLQARLPESAAAPSSGDFLPPTGPIRRETTAPATADRPAAAVIKQANSSRSASMHRTSEPRTSTDSQRASSSSAAPSTNRPIPVERTAASTIFEQEVDSLLGKKAIVASRLDKKSDPSLRPIIIGSTLMLLIIVAAIAWASRDRLGKLTSSSTSETEPFAEQSVAQQPGTVDGAASDTTDATQSAPVDNPKQSESNDARTNQVNNPATAIGTSEPEITFANANVQESDPKISPTVQSPEDAAALKKALADTRAALAKRNLAQARRHLEKATALAKSPEQEADLARWTSMTDYVDGFWQAVSKGMRGLQAADELEVGDKIAAVVEIDLKKITLHVEGKNRSFTLSDMPASLAVTLAQRWFDPNLPANKLYLGAFHVVDPKGDAAAARRLWQEATRQGASAEELMPLLTQTPTRGKTNDQTLTSQANVPDDKEAAAARRAVRARFQRELAVTRSPDQKIALAETLREAASNSENTSEQYALLREACDLAAGRGDLSEIETAVEAIAERFKVDALGLKVEVLKKASDSANHEIAGALAASSLQLAEVVIRESREDVGRRLVPVILSAARKSGDPSLMEQAQKTRSMLEQLKPAARRQS